MSDKSQLADLAAAVERHGMLVRGGFALTDEDEGGLAGFPHLASRLRGRTLLLIGNAGPALYQAFSASGPVTGNHPLDDWTKRMLLPIAARFGARAAFPSDGPPWLPFQRWAIRAEGVKASPLGVLIHPVFGLWHAYRAAFVFDHVLDLPPAPMAGHPCDSCDEKPCLVACPVGAVAGSGYAVDKCAPHVASDRGLACRAAGCLSRRACPVGSAYVYPDWAMSFHMRAFLRGRGTTISHPPDSEGVH